MSRDIHFPPLVSRCCRDETCVCVRACVSVWVCPGVFTHPLGVSRSSGTAQHQNQQRADPQPPAAWSLHPDGHTAAESRLITESPARTQWARDGRAPLSGSAKFGSVRFGSAPLSSQGVRAAWSRRGSATSFGMERGRQSADGGVQARNIQHHTSGPRFQNKSMRSQRSDEVRWHVLLLTQIQQD